MITALDYSVPTKGCGPPETSIELLSTITQLAWDDLEAFLSLEANCLSRNPVKINQRVKEKLESLGLIDENGYTPINVCSIVQSIAYDYQSQYN